MDVSEGSLSDIDLNAKVSRSVMLHDTAASTLQAGHRDAWEKPLSTPQDDMIRILKQKWACNAGVVLVLLSMFFAASMDMAVRLLELRSGRGTPVNTFQILLFRQVLTSAGIITYGLLTKEKAWNFLFGDRKVLGLLIARGVAGFVAVFGIYFSLPSLSLIEATVLTFMAPIITCYANKVLLKGEPYNCSQQLASGISISGILIIAFVAKGGDPVYGATKQTDTRESNVSSGTRRLAIFTALLGVLGQAGGMIATRHIGPRAHSLTIIHYSSLASMLLCAIAVCVMPSFSLSYMSPKQWALLLLATFCGFMFQLLLTLGLQYGAATPVDQVADSTLNEENEPFMSDGDGCSSTVSQRTSRAEKLAPEQGPFRSQVVGVNRAVGMMYTQAIFALFYDFTVWRNLPSVPCWVGISLIVVGAIWVAVTK